MWWFFSSPICHFPQNTIISKSASLAACIKLTFYLPYLETLFLQEVKFKFTANQVNTKTSESFISGITFNTVLYALTGRAKVDNLQFSIWQKLLRMWKIDTLTLNYFRGKVIIFWATISKIAAIVRVNSWIAFDQIQTQTWNE